MSLQKVNHQRLLANSPNGMIEGGVEYDASNGNVKIKVRGLLGSTAFTPTLFENGQWTAEGKRVVPAATRELWIPIVSKAIIDTHEAAGGNGNKAVIPGWVKTEAENFNTDDAAKLNEKNHHYPDKVSVTSGDPTNKPSFATQGTKLSPHTGNTIKELMKSAGGYLNYPNDAIYSGDDTGYNQDHVRITQYTYKPPRPTLVKQGDGETIGKKLSQGIQRGSALKDYLGMVKLPMPSDVSDSNNVSWGEDSMNNISAAITGAIGQNLGANAGAKFGGGAVASLLGFSGGGDAAVSAGLGIKALGEGGLEALTSGAGGQTVAATLQSRILAGQGIEVSAESILARQLGRIPNANLELLFNSPTLREFNFSWKMTPRSKGEAKTVRNIIRFFKQGMAARKMASKAGKASLFLGTPNVFHIQYKTNESFDIEGVNKIKTVAVTGCAINYTPDGVWSAYEDGQPTSTVMSLRMQELEPVYDTDYSTDIMKERLFNDDIDEGGKVGGGLYQVGINEVGY